MAGVAAVVAIGRDQLLLRRWSVPDDLEMEVPALPLTDQGWSLVDAWQSQLARPDWERRLSALFKLALWQAGAPHIADLPELPPNAALLDNLRPGGKPATGPERHGSVVADTGAP